MITMKKHKNPMEEFDFLHIDNGYLIEKRLYYLNKLRNLHFGHEMAYEYQAIIERIESEIYLNDYRIKYIMKKFYM